MPITVEAARHIYTRSRVHFIKIGYLRPSAGYGETANFAQLLALPAGGGPPAVRVRLPARILYKMHQK